MTSHRPLAIAGAFEVCFSQHTDARGTFVRAFCAETFAALGIDSRVAQSSLSTNPRRGTLRGIHWQAAPHEETKLVRCVAGAAWDVVVDLRPSSPTFGTWSALVLDPARANAMCVPPGCGHGFVTLEPATVLLYQMSAAFAPSAARSVRFDDPDLAIAWPVAPTTVGDRDRLAPHVRDVFPPLPTIRRRSSASPDGSPLQYAA